MTIFIHNIVLTNWNETLILWQFQLKYTVHTVYTVIKFEFIIILEMKTSAKPEVEHIQILPRWIYQGIMLSMIIISVIVIAANAPTATVIAIAQVFNGCLLPLFSICLILCLNDPQFMNKKPQKW